jgi:hypothetical protein
MRSYFVAQEGMDHCLLMKRIPAAHNFMPGLKQTSHTASLWEAVILLRAILRRRRSISTDLITTSYLTKQIPRYRQMAHLNRSIAKP